MRLPRWLDLGRYLREQARRAEVLGRWKGRNMIASPRGIVVHWTGGTYQANAVDRLHYHWIVEGDGRIVRGKYRMRDNMRMLAPGDQYAAHTGGWNSYRIGLACAGMKDYRGRSSVGLYPLKESQVERMLRLAARICFVFGLDPLDPRVLCTHREVWTLHGVKGTRNHQKTDIEYLPFRPELKPAEVGPYLRKCTKSLMPRGGIVHRERPATTERRTDDHG